MNKKLMVIQKKKSQKISKYGMDLMIRKKNLKNNCRVTSHLCYKIMMKKEELYGILLRLRLQKQLMLLRQQFLPYLVLFRTYFLRWRRSRTGSYYGS